MSSRLSTAAKERQDEDFDEIDKAYETRSSSSVRRYNMPAQRDTLGDGAEPTSIPMRRRRSNSAAVSANASSVSPAAPAHATSAEHDTGEHIKVAVRRLPLGAIFIGMVAMTLLIIVVGAISSWWTVFHDDMTYGRPRTFQVDAVVGHNDSAANPTHFLFINLNRHVEIIELPGGDAAHAKIYAGPYLYGPGQELTPVTAEVRDVNGDGKLDLIIHIQDQQLIMINTGTEFRPLQAGEKVNL